MALVSIVDRDCTWFLAVHGLQSARHGAAAEELAAGLDAAGHAVLVEDALTDPRTAHNAFVRDHQIRFYARAPITTADNYRLGAVAVLDTQSHTATQEQLGILGDLADLVMDQLESRLSSLDNLRFARRQRDAAEFARDDARLDRDTAEIARDDARLDRDDAIRHRDIAEHTRDVAEHERDLITEYATVLQRTLLPPSLPEIDGLALAAHYHPASPRQVGGDFYDVFALGHSRWAFFIGDVEGHGAEAAVATSLIRYTLRAAALHFADPTEVLAELNAALLRELDPRRFCTVLFGNLEPASGGHGFEVTIATGGHPPALLLDPCSGSASQVRSADGMLVGMTSNATFDSCRVRLSPGEILLFYTDGIVESRRATPPFDEHSLADFAVEHAGLGAAGLIDRFATLVPKLNPDDDVAVLAIGAR
ncbi:serine/threonine-protein phosphatase [Mycobacterium vicinigordonae]|uniref:Serine/threonine-protein phosphatase n=2 Tax=Mycobacterium vicinigordonae TaxID=1719132 RepID=A0A7D6HZ00_9MYCO|nr:serine/threonine-protein phosphatase [Mycobacterium vicinigordonae]